jgi:hypothetical protein
MNYDVIIHTDASGHAAVIEGVSLKGIRWLEDMGTTENGNRYLIGKTTDRDWESRCHNNDMLYTIARHEATALEIRGRI